MSTLCLILWSILIGIVTFLAYKRYDHFQLFKKLGIPGPKPNYIFGNIVQLRFSKKKNLFEVLDDWKSSYGNIYGYFSGRIPVLVVEDLELIKDILIRNSSKFINRPKLIVNTKPIRHTLVGQRGQQWKELRSILTPTFSSSKMRQMTQLMCESLSETINILDELEKNEGFDVVELYQGLTCEVISKCALAMKVNCQRDKEDEFLKSVKGFLAHALNPLVFIALCFPIIGKVLGLIIDKFAVSGQMTRMICKNVSQVLKHRRQEVSKTKNLQPKYLDVLQLMIDTRPIMDNTDKLTIGNDGIEKQMRILTDDEIIANAWVFVLGGFETTAAVLSFTTYLLTIHQDVQSKLFQELQSSFYVDEIPSYDVVKGLIYLDQIICETLRLYPPVVTFLIRETQEETTIGSYVIPSDVTINIPVWQIHHDPKLWPNPYEFDPERFNQTNRKNHHSMSWIPFGAGPRNCIGSRFGLLETKLAICRIFRKFRFYPCEKTEYNLKLTVPTVVISPENGIFVRCEQRLD